jgi:hypothetical protein
MNEIVVAVWVLFAGEQALPLYPSHRFAQEFTTKQRCEDAAARFMREFARDSRKPPTAFCVPK